MALKTAWTVSIPDDRGSTRDGGDPLGFRSYANRLARELVPMLTQSTFQTRGFSLLCLGVEVAAKTQSEADAQRAFQHTERLWAAASVFHQGDDAPVAGKRRAKHLLVEAEATGEYPLERPLFNAISGRNIWRLPPISGCLWTRQRCNWQGYPFPRGSTDQDRGGAGQGLPLVGLPGNQGRALGEKGLGVANPGARSYRGQLPDVGR